MARETPSSNLCVTSIGAAIFIFTLNHADVIGDQSDAVTQNVWFRCALCAAISGEISILIQTGAESWGRFPVKVTMLLYFLSLSVTPNKGDYELVKT